MAIIRPFRGLRPQSELAKKVASPPYDVLNSREAREMARGNPISFLHVNKSEIDFDDGINPYSREVYLRGRQNLQHLIDRESFSVTPNRAFISTVSPGGDGARLD